MIYFVKCAVTGFVKVGSTGDSVKALCRRIRELRVGPTPLYLVGTSEGDRVAEISFHKWLHGLGRSSGHGEWFTVHEHELPGFHTEIPEDLKVPMASSVPGYLVEVRYTECARCMCSLTRPTRGRPRKYCADCLHVVFSDRAAAARGKPASADARSRQYEAIRKNAWKWNGKTLTELSHEHGIPRSCITGRMSRGMTIEEALSAKGRVRTVATPLFAKADDRGAE